MKRWLPLLLCAFLGSVVDHVVELGGTEVRSRGGVRGTIRPGTAVRLRFAEESCALVDVESGDAR